MTVSQFIGGRAVVDVIYVGKGPAPTTGGSSTTMDFTGVSYGDAEPDRTVKIIVSFVSSTSGITVSAGTIGGVAYSVDHIHSTLIITTYHYVAIISAPVPTGTSGAVQINFSSSVTNDLEIDVYSLLGLLSATPIDTGQFAVSGVTSGSFNIDAQAGGAILFGLFARISAGFTLTGVNEDYDAGWVASGTYSIAGGSYEPTADELNRTVTANRGTNFTGVGVGASYR